MLSIDFLETLLCMIITLVTNWSRFPKKLPAISQAVAQNLLNERQKLVFVTKVAQKFLRKKKKCCSLPESCSDAEISKLYSNSRFLSLFVEFCGVSKNCALCNINIDLIKFFV